MGAGGRRNLSFQHQGKEIYEQCRSRSRSTCSTPPPSSLSVFVPPGMAVVVSDCYMIVQGAVLSLELEEQVITS